jgi:hypothetical protein
MASVRGCGYVNGASETKPFTLDQPWRRKVRMTSGLPLQQSSPSAQAREAFFRNALLVGCANQWRDRQVRWAVSRQELIQTIRPARGDSHITHPFGSLRFLHSRLQVVHHAACILISATAAGNTHDRAPSPPGTSAHNTTGLACESHIQDLRSTTQP